MDTFAIALNRWLEANKYYGSATNTRAFHLEPSCPPHKPCNFCDKGAMVVAK